MKILLYVIIRFFYSYAMFTYVNIDVERRRYDVSPAARVCTFFWATAGAAHGVSDQVAVHGRSPRFREGEVIPRRRRLDRPV